MGPKMDSLLYAILGSDRQILKGVEARSVVPVVWSATRAFPLLLPPSPSFPLLLPLSTAAFSTIMAKRKATAGQLEAQAEFNGHKRGVRREKVSTEVYRVPDLRQGLFYVQLAALPRHP